VVLTLSKTRKGWATPSCGGAKVGHPPFGPRHWKLVNVPSVPGFPLFDNLLSNGIGCTDDFNVA
jgi:hypothetical protein